MKLIMVLCALPLVAQIAVERPTGRLRSYEATTVPPVKLTNSPRLRELIVAGRIRLTAQDAISLAIENNLDLETQRYGQLISEWNVQRAEAGGLLPGVGNSASQIGQVASGQGISGSQRSAGVSSNSGGSADNTGNASISQIGPVTANLDPVLQNTTLFSHTTTPQSNSVQSRTNSLVDGSHIYNTSFQQGFLSGGYVQASYNESYLRENTLTDVLNPSVAPRAQIYVQHNLLQGLGAKVNGRFIRVARNNDIATRGTFQSSLINLVTNVLNLYWDLVSDENDVSAKRQARDVAQKFLEDTRKQIEIGTVAKTDLFRAESEAAFRQEAYALAVSSEEQQQNLLKNLLSREELDLSIEAVDRMPAPDTSDLPPLRSLVARALAKRPDIAAAKLNAQSAEISAYGTDNGLLPTLVGYASTTQSGLSGTDAGGPDAYFVGGLGNALGQVFRRNFPSQRAGLALPSVPVLADRIDQADYGIDQLQLRQTQLALGRELNQLVVDIANQAVALRQSRARYQTAVKARAVQEALLEGEQNKFNLASSNLSKVVIARRSLSAAESTEAAALAAYNHARIALDEVLGETLEVNGVSTNR